MQKAALSILATLSLAISCAAQLPSHSATIDVRYSAQISNAGPGTCGCFSLQGGAADLYVNILGIGANHGPSFGLAVDGASEHTGSVNGAAYGLTLTTFTVGPRIVLRGRKLEPFGQALFGFAHGSNSAFPVGGSLDPSTNAFALDAGGAMDYMINKRFSVRFVQADYLRTSLPNLSSNWQNNLRIAAGVTLHLQ
jgi:hypothetical protein